MFFRMFQLLLDKTTSLWEFVNFSGLDLIVPMMLMTNTAKAAFVPMPLLRLYPFVGTTESIIIWIIDPIIPCRKRYFANVHDGVYGSCTDAARISNLALNDTCLWIVVITCPV
jgi:hypothetical protein